MSATKYPELINNPKFVCLTGKAPVQEEQKKQTQIDETELFRYSTIAEEGFFYKVVAWYADCSIFMSYPNEAHLNAIIKDGENEITDMLREGHNLQKIGSLFRQCLLRLYGIKKSAHRFTIEEKTSFFKLIVCLQKLRITFGETSFGWQRVSKKDFAMEYERPGRTGLVCVDDKNTVFDCITEMRIGTFEPHKEEFTFNIRPTKCNWCANCKEKISKRKCSCCRNVYYCSEDCQNANWKTHREECVSIADDTSGGKWVPCGVCDLPPAFCLWIV
jgi:hypothetical protein